MFLKEQISGCQQNDKHQATTSVKVIEDNPQSNRMFLYTLSPAQV